MRASGPVDSSGTLHPWWLMTRRNPHNATTVVMALDPATGAGAVVRQIDIEPLRRPFAPNLTTIAAIVGSAHGEARCCRSGVVSHVTKRSEDMRPPLSLVRREQPPTPRPPMTSWRVVRVADARALHVPDLDVARRTFEQVFVRRILNRQLPTRQCHEDLVRWAALPRRIRVRAAKDLVHLVPEPERR
jgi:hypothetical protein